MDFGFSCWLYSTWASEILIFRKDLTLQKFGDCFHDSRDLLLSRFRIHRQRKNLLRRPVRVRKVTGPMTERGVQRLHMQRVRIIDGAADFSFAQEFLKRIALLDSNGVLVIDVF